METQLKDGQKRRLGHYIVGGIVIVGMIAIAWAALNIQQLISRWTVSNETRQLEKRAAYSPEDVENPEVLTDDFEEGLSTEFWDFTIINGAGQASNETTWHAVEMEIDHELILRHTSDPSTDMLPSHWVLLIRCRRIW